MKNILLDYMGVLFLPYSIVEELIRRYGKEEEIRRTFRMASLGNEEELRKVVSWEEQLRALESIRPKFSFSILEKLKERGYSLYGFTNMPPSYVEFVENRFHVSKYLEETFSSASIGAKKPHGRIYEYVEDKLGEIFIYFDDREENVEAAKERGWNAVLCNRDEEPLNTLKAILEGEYEKG